MHGSYIHKTLYKAFSLHDHKFVINLELVQQPQSQVFHSRFCLAPLQSCETKTESLGSRLLVQYVMTVYAVLIETSHR